MKILQHQVDEHKNEAPALQTEFWNVEITIRSWGRWSWSIARNCFISNENKSSQLLQATIHPQAYEME